jgi:single-strand DNA-binding protein
VASFHQTIIVGHLGRDPESRNLPSGDAVCNFSVAVTEKWKDKAGDTKEQTTWYRVNAFGKLAEICGQYLKKGSLVMLTGKMQARKFEKDGVERESWELKADQLQMLSGRDGAAGGGAPAQRPAAAPAARPAAAPAGGFDDMDDDIPF